MWLGDLLQVTVPQAGPNVPMPFPGGCSEEAFWRLRSLLAYESLLWLCLDAAHGCQLVKNNSKNVCCAQARRLDVNLEATPVRGAKKKKREKIIKGGDKNSCFPLFLVLDIFRIQPVLKLISKIILSLFRELSAFPTPM